MSTISSIPRRRFLNQVTAAAATGSLIPAIIPASALGRDGYVAPNDRIEMGIIGFVRQCVARNLPIFARRSDCQIVSLCDVDPRLRM